jgi:exopolyphosphatase / guanosine-5'-triphosphate,3'-diphosphate pyrophosphatase
MKKRFAAIDIGTNTIKIKIADHTPAGNFEQVLYKDFPSCLGHNMINGIIDSTALPECYAVLKEIGIILKDNKVDEYKCIATHALRVAGNQSEVRYLIKSNTEFDVYVISGEEEVRLTLLAVMLDNKGENFVCINGGGGSTELGFHLPDGDKLVLFDFGAVNLYTDYIKGRKDIDSAIDRVGRLITRDFNKKVNFPTEDIEQVISLGGSIFTAGYIYKKDDSRDFEQLANLKISIDGIVSIINILKSATENEQKKIPGMDPKRLNTILPGILIHYFLLQLLNKDKLVISTRSISDGLIYRMAEGNTVK